jgi:hypothetical protein
MQLPAVSDRIIALLNSSVAAPVFAQFPASP